MPRRDSIPDQPLVGRLWTGGIGLMLLGFLAYLPCLNGPFLWDDRNWSHGIEWLLQDPHGWVRIWTNVRLLEQYYPLTATTVWLDYQCWGWAVFPRHVENVMLHVSAAFFLWRLLRRLEMRGAWLAAALLVVHPVAVESVAWITERKNVLCLALALLSMLCWCRGVHDWKGDATPRRGWLVLAMVLCLLAMLAKISACVVPPALVVIAWWKRGGIRWRQDVLPTLPMFVMALGLGVLIAWLERHQAGAMGPVFDELSWPKRLLIASQAVWFYLAKLVWPHPLCVVYHRWTIEPGVWWQWSGLAGLVISGVWLWKKGSRSLKAAALLFLGPLLPVIGFLNLNGMRFAWVADRWVYFSMPVFCAVVACTVVRLPRRWQMITAGILIGVCSLLTWQQSALYDSTETFWQAAIRGNPHPVVGHSAYGEFLMHEGRLEESKKHFEEALRLEPENAAFHCNLGSLLDVLGENEQARASVARAIERDGSDALFHYNHGFSLYKLGRAAEAEASFREALRLRQEFFAAHHDLGNLLAAMGRLDEAESELNLAIVLRPTDAKATASLGNLRYRQGRKAEALELFEKALFHLPDNMPLLSNTARILATSSDASLRNGPRAVGLAEKAAEIGGHKDVGVLSTLAAAYAEVGRFDEAVKTARKALQLAEEAQMPAGVIQSLRLTLQVVEAGQPVRAAER